MADHERINWLIFLDMLDLLNQASNELAAAGDPVPDSLVKAYRIGKQLAEKADHERQKTGSKAPNAGDCGGH